MEKSSNKENIMLVATPDGMIFEAIWHIACVVYNHSEPREGQANKVALDDEEIIHLMSALHSLSGSYLRERRIC